MKLNPADITHQEFNRALRGYNPDEVSAFLEVVAENYTELSDENRALLQKLKQTEQDAEQLRSKLEENEKTLIDQKSELLKIERLMDSKIDADFVTQKAEREAETIVAEARKKAHGIISEMEFLQEQKSKVAAYVREYLKSQLALVDIIEDNEAKMVPAPSAKGLSELANGKTTSPSDAVELSEADALTLPVGFTEAPSDDGIQSFLKDIHLDDIPQEIAEEIKKDIALHGFSEDPLDEKRKKVLDDLDAIMKTATGMFKKSDFHKMLGDDASKKAEDMINQIYDELEKKKSKPKS